MRLDADDFAHFEWERPFAVEIYLRSTEFLGPAFSCITIERDHRGVLNFVAKGTAQPGQVSDDMRAAALPGKIYKVDNQVDVDWPGGTGRLNGLQTWRWKERLISSDVSEVELRGTIASLVASYTDRPVETLIEWVVNLNDLRLWPDETETEISSTYRRLRRSPVAVQIGTEKPALLREFTRDHVTFQVRQLPGVTIQLGVAHAPAVLCNVRPGFISYAFRLARLTPEGIVVLPAIARFAPDNGPIVQRQAHPSP